MARALGADGFAEVAPLISIFYLVQIGLFVTMAVSARYTAPLAARGENSLVNRAYRDLTLYCTVIGTLGMLLFIFVSPEIHNFLHVPLGPVVGLSATVPLCLLVGIGRGVLQGEERFVPLSLNFITYGSTTLVFLPVLLHFQLRAVGAVVAINLALVLCNLFRRGHAARPAHAAHHQRLHMGRILRSSLGASAGIAVITLFYNFDVLLAKHFLGGNDPGLYSAMSLLGKILFFGTISISAVMFPRVAALHSQGKSSVRVVDLSLAMVTAAGAVVVAFYWLFPGFTVSVLLHRAEYHAIEPYLPGIFALAMLGLALSNVLVYYFVGVHRRRFVVGPIIGALAFVGLLSNFHSSLGQFTTSVTASIDLMALVLLLLYLVERRTGAQSRGTRWPMPDRIEGLVRSCWSTRPDAPWTQRHPRARGALAALPDRGPGHRPGRDPPRRGLRIRRRRDGDGQEHRVLFDVRAPPPPLLWEVPCRVPAGGQDLGPVQTGAWWTS